MSDPKLAPAAHQERTEPTLPKKVLQAALDIVQDDLPPEALDGCATTLASYIIELDQQAAPARAAEWQPLTTKQKIHILVAEIRCCFGDDHLLSAVIHRKLDAIDAELTEPLPPCALTGTKEKP